MTGRAAGPKRVTVRNPSSNSSADYLVLVGSGALSEQTLASAIGGRRIFVVTSQPIRDLHGGKLDSALGSAATVHWLMVPDGETAKSVGTAERLWSEMLDQGGKRDSLVVAFGGGSVGDLAGFVAASFLRGIDFVQIPTTLLAQVDASVGGKVAVDLPAGKNTVGAFHQPKLVVADVDLLLTLDQRDLSSGLVESAKMGAILNLDLLERVERDMSALMDRDLSALVEVVADSVRTKARVVESDPFEKDQRRLLNFGHTLGHAIEVCLGYKGLRHGEAVAWGSIFATQLSQARGLDRSQGERLTYLMTSLTTQSLPQLAAQDLLAACAKDKKALEAGLAWVLCPALGSGSIATDLDRALVDRELESFLNHYSA